MDTKHTHRRWFATQHPDNKARWFVQSDLMGGFDICEVSNYPKEANARLIAAAPELLQELDRLADNMAFVLNHAALGEWFHKFAVELEEARAAIAKATQP